MWSRADRPVLQWLCLLRTEETSLASQSETGQTKTWDWSDNFAGFGILSGEEGGKKLNKWGEQVLITVDTEEEEEEEMVNIILPNISLVMSRRGEGGGNI